MEFALVTPFLLLMLFGIIEFGITMNDYQSIRQGVREAARDAVVADYGSTSSCNLNGSAASGSSTAQMNARKVICKAKERAAIGDDLRVRVVYTAPTDTSAGSTDRGQVKVCAARPVRSLTGLIAPFVQGTALKSEIQMRGEKDLNSSSGAAAAQQLTTLGETDPTGQSWSWC